MPKPPPSTAELLHLLNNFPLPASAEAEEALLSCFFEQPDKRLASCLSGAERLSIEAFHHPANRMIFDAMVHLYVDQQPVEPVTVTNRLRDWNELDKCGGPARVSEIFTASIPNSSWEHYRAIVEDCWLRRRLIHTLAERILAVSELDDEGRPVPARQLVVESEGALSNLAPPSSRGGLQHVKKIIPKALSEIETAFSRRGHVTRGQATGFTDLDRATMGVETGLFIIAARPSKGKTVLMGQWALNAALARGDYTEFNQPPISVGIWSLETESSRLVRRMLCNLSEINMGRARDGMFSRGSQQALQAESLRLADAEIYIESCFGLTIQELRVKVRQAVRRHRLRIVFIDYMQLLTSSSRAAEMSRTTAIAEVSQGLKHMAHELDIPVVALAQINRDGDVPRPSMADIKDCGQIEQDADYIGILCDAPSIAEDMLAEGDEPRADTAEADFHVGLDLVKLKEGRTTTDGDPIKLRFDRGLFRMLSTTERLFSSRDEQRQM